MLKKTTFLSIIILLFISFFALQYFQRSSFGKDIYASLRKSSAEAIAALFLLGVVIVETP